MFSDLVGSAALSNRLDPEDLRDLLRTYQKRSPRRIAGFEGYVAEFGGRRALFSSGIPEAHEDDAERAVHAGLKTIEALARLRTQAGAPLAHGWALPLALWSAGTLSAKA